MVQVNTIGYEDNQIIFVKYPCIILKFFIYNIDKQFMNKSTCINLQLRDVCVCSLILLSYRSNNAVYITFCNNLSPF